MVKKIKRSHYSGALYNLKYVCRICFTLWPKKIIKETPKERFLKWKYLEKTIQPYVMQSFPKKLN